MKTHAMVAILVFAAIAAATAGEAPGTATPAAPTTATPVEETPSTETRPASATATTKSADSEESYLSYDEPGPPQPPGLAALAGRTIGSLAVVIGLIFVTGLVLRRYMSGGKAPTTSRKVSELVEVTPLGSKRYLYLIRVADRLLVVGAGGDGLSLLSEIRDPEVLAQVASLPRRSDFFDLFHRTTGAQREADAEAPAEHAATG
ncbi:MAG: FliO/MopB family protein [bacterium]